MIDYIHVVIVGTHPHAGERGRIKVVDDKVTVEQPLGGLLGRKAVVELDDCLHGVTSCYISPGQIRVVEVGS